MPKTEATTRKYMYCIIRSSEPAQFTSLGIGERGDIVYTVPFMQMAAVASDSPNIEYDESRRNMMAHTVVLEEAMRQFTILPVRFGTVAPNTEAILEKVLKRRYGELISLFEEVDGRLELGLKAFWYEGAIFREILEENPAIVSLRNSLMGSHAEETYYERIRLGEMIESAMWKKRDQDAEKILERLRPLAYKSRANKVITDRMVLNAAFLVNHQNEAGFDRVVQEMDAEMASRLMFKYVGPVPPYNFVNIQVHWTE